MNRDKTTDVEGNITKFGIGGMKNLFRPCRNTPRGVFLQKRVNQPERFRLTAKNDLYFFPYF